MWVSVAALTTWVLIAFYNRETDTTKGTSEVVSAIGSGNAAKWYTFTGALFALGCVFIVAMYVKDTKSVRWFWAVPLALLRMTVYAVLCFVFLLPAMQTWEDTNKQSRVVILLDISHSITHKDATDEIVLRKDQKAKRRIDVIIEMLTDERINFLKNLLDKNPVAVYAFGSRLDESPDMIAQGDPAWNKAEWEAFASYDFHRFILLRAVRRGERADSEIGGLAGQRRLPTGPATWFAHKKKTRPQTSRSSPRSSPDSDADILRKNLERLDKRIEVAKTIMDNTNVADSVTAAVNRESANMVQGIIVISDGRSNLGSDSGYAEVARTRANREKIPIFTIGVGEDRQTVSISITSQCASGERRHPSTKPGRSYRRGRRGEPRKQGNRGGA